MTSEEMMAGFGDLTAMLGQVKQMQARMQQLQQDLQNRTAQAASGGGMVTATVNGNGELLDLKIDPALDLADREMLEDLIKAAVNAAVAKNHEQMKQEMAKLTGGLNLPGLDLLGKMLG